jgi:hypothetical protein
MRVDKGKTKYNLNSSILDKSMIQILLERSKTSPTRSSIIRPYNLV